MGASHGCRDLILSLMSWFQRVAIKTIKDALYKHFMLAARKTAVWLGLFKLRDGVVICLGESLRLAWLFLLFL